MIREKYNNTWEDEAILDLQKSVQKVSYCDLNNGECGTVLYNAKDKLGKKHRYNFFNFILDYSE